MVQEAQDGYDAIEWAAVQPWSSGKVGTTSGSYLGLTQWQPAILQPPHLAAICPQITASDYHDNWTYVNAVFDLWFGMSWPAAQFVVDSMTRGLQVQGVPQSQIDSLVAAFSASVTANLTTKWGLPAAPYGLRPVHDVRTVLLRLAGSPDYDDFWKGWMSRRTGRT